MIKKCQEKLACILNKLFTCWNVSLNNVTPMHNRKIL